MAKYTVTHACGHSSAVTLYGKGVERERAMRRMAERPCNDCLKAEELRRAQAKAERQALPDLVGTDKQIAWAERIRYEALMALGRWVKNEWLDIAVPIPDDLAFVPGETTTMRAEIQRIRGEDDCRWWIDYAKRVHDIGRVPLYDDQAFCIELLRARAIGERVTTGSLARSADIRDQFRALYQ